MQVEEFMKAHKPERPRSRLEPHAAALALLDENGYTLAQQLDYLKANGIVVGAPTLSKFLRRRLVPSAAERPKARSANGKPMASTPKNETPASQGPASAAVAASSPSDSVGPQRFHWDPTVTDAVREELIGPRRKP